MPMRGEAASADPNAHERTQVMHWWRLLNWWSTRSFVEWRVRPFTDNMWYVEELHRDHGWVVHPSSASKLRRDAVAWAHHYYTRPTKQGHVR